MVDIDQHKAVDRGVLESQMPDKSPNQIVKKIL